MTSISPFALFVRGVGHLGSGQLSHKVYCNSTHLCTQKMIETTLSLTAQNNYVQVQWIKSKWKLQNTELSKPRNILDAVKLQLNLKSFALSTSNLSIPSVCTIKSKEIEPEYIVQSSDLLLWMELTSQLSAYRTSSPAPSHSEDMHSRLNWLVFWNMQFRTGWCSSQWLESIKPAQIIS